MQRVLDRLLALDAVCPPDSGKTDLQMLHLVLADMEEFASQFGTGNSCKDRLQQCGEKLQILDSSVRDSAGTGMVATAEAAPVIASLADTARTLLRETEQNVKEDGPVLFDRLVFLVPAVLVLLFLVVYFYNGMVVHENTMQLYWHGDGQTYREADSLRQCAMMDGEWRDYKFDTGGEGVTQARLDPVGDGSLAQSIEIRRIAFYDGEKESWQEIGLGSWACQGCEVGYSGGILVVEPDGIDPWMALPPAEDGVISRVLVGARIMPARLWPWRWLQIYTGREKQDFACPGS